MVHFYMVWINLEQAPRLAAMEQWFYYNGSFLYGLINLEQATRLAAMEQWFYHNGSFSYGLH